MASEWRDAAARRNPRRRSRSLMGRLRGIRRTIWRLVRRTRLLLWLGLAACLVLGFVWVSKRNDVSLLGDAAAPTTVRTLSGADAASAGRSDALPSVNGAAAEIVVRRTATAPSPSDADDAMPAAAAASPVTPPRSSPATDPVRRETIARGTTAPVVALRAAADGAGDTAETLDAVLGAAVRVRDPLVHVVNDGGSWWRTARRVVDDPVLLDKLLDNLSASGMDVASVTPGAELVADRAATDGLLLRIDAPSGVYVSRVGEDAVVTTRYRTTLIEIESTFARDAAAAGLSDDVVAALLRADAARSLGLDAVAPGETYGVLHLRERDFGTGRTTEQAVALVRDGRLLWVDQK